MRRLKQIALAALYLAVLAGLGTVAAGCARGLLVRRTPAKATPKEKPVESAPAPPPDPTGMSNSPTGG